MIMPEPRYYAAPFKSKGVFSLMVCDDRTGRIVKIPLIKSHACTLGQMLNVAHLEERPADDGAAESHKRYDGPRCQARP